MSTVTIIMRSRNDKGVIERTLAALQEQTYKDWELLNIDSESSDGTDTMISQHATKQIGIKASSYIPGKILNMGARQTDSPLLVYLNSDCVPQGEDWLANMVEGLATSPVVYGRQIARKDAWLLYERDYQHSFPATERQPKRRWHHNGSFQHFFSMANCGLRREVWESIPFDDNLQYSEDIDWAIKVREAGLPITYMPDAVVEHSHNYTASECYKRFFGEGKTDGLIFPRDQVRDSFAMMVVLPYLNALRNDLAFAHKESRWKDALPSIALRWNMYLGRYHGLHEARKA